MEKKNSFTKVLAIVGTVLVWFPILAPILLAIVMFFAEGRFLLDYLMPAELFLFALAGSGLLFWAALRAHSHVRLIVWGTGIAVFLFFGVQWFAEITGLASGATEPVGWMWAVVIASLAIYSLALIMIGTGGALIVRDLFVKRLPSLEGR